MKNEWYFVREEGENYVIYRKINLYGGTDQANVFKISEHENEDEAIDNCLTYNKRM